MKKYLTTAFLVIFSFVMVSCNCTKNSFNTEKATSQEIMTNLNNTSWSLKRLDVDNRDFVPTDEQKELTLSFQDINYSSSDGCNGQGGEFEIEDNKISFTKGMSTMRYCGDEMKHLIYSVPFGSVKSMEIKKDQLQLLDSDKKVIATYTRKK
ncbi:META domain-containing protein [Paenimyroides viscosum]|uniref:META domain-containing protein n=1 Tax=Paenimyroides viscosum TaxID=2488729 RepID=A0A3P1B5Q0_9FLAO|nr:META domain-containing protein [Paenimyroides viscosum]RRA96289.1 META domain-containing protein [Paenimyroides viscosum]